MFSIYLLICYLIDSAFTTVKNYLVFLEECKYVVKEKRCLSTLETKKKTLMKKMLINKILIKKITMRKILRKKIKYRMRLVFIFKAF